MAVDESWQRIHPGLLTWSDVDPAGHPFDPAGALAAVREAAPPVPPRPDIFSKEWRAERAAAEQWRSTLSHRLADRYGRWAVGWCWSPGEGDYDGGPVGGWCCSGHSITTPDQTLALVADCLAEWRGWLEELARRFEQLCPDPGSDPHLGWELAISRLVTVCVDRTSSMSGWHGHCGMVLTWFLDYAGVPMEEHPTLVADAIGGSFRSWAEPSALAVEHVAGRIAEAVTARPPAGPPDTDAEEERPPARPGRPSGPPHDALRAWLDIRARVAWDAITSPALPDRRGRDGIAQEVARRDAGGPELRAALDQARQAARAGAPLSFGLLAEWQATALGKPSPGFRTGTAWAKRGRERYHWEPGLAERFERHLAEANDTATPLASRAARAYLDICFYHPFDNGNGRAALLALDFLLTRAGVVLQTAGPVLRTSWYAHDRKVSAALARLIERGIRSE